MKKPEATVAAIMPMESPRATDVCHCRTEVASINRRRHARTVKTIGPRKTAVITVATDARMSKRSAVIALTHNIHRQNVVLHQTAAKRQTTLYHLCT